MQFALSSKINVSKTFAAKVRIRGQQDGNLANFDGDCDPPAFGESTAFRRPRSVDPHLMRIMIEIRADARQMRANSVVPSIRGWARRADGKKKKRTHSLAHSLSICAPHHSARPGPT
jgi:hypothetical protein